MPTVHDLRIDGEPNSREGAITELANDSVTAFMKSVTNVNGMKTARAVELGPFHGVAFVLEALFCLGRGQSW
jgi:hypothetical protein